MNSIRRIEDLEIWQDARKLARDLFFLTRKDPIAKGFSFKDQIMRTVISVPVILQKDLRETETNNL